MNSIRNKDFVILETKEGFDMEALHERIEQNFEKIETQLPSLNPVNQSVVMASLSHLRDLKPEAQLEWLNDVLDGFNYLEDDAYEGAEALKGDYKKKLSELKNVVTGAVAR